MEQSLWLAQRLMSSAWIRDEMLPFLHYVEDKDLGIQLVTDDRTNEITIHTWEEIPDE